MMFTLSGVVRLIIMMGAVKLQIGAVLVTCFYGKTNVVNEMKQVTLIRQHLEKEEYFLQYSDLLKD